LQPRESFAIVCFWTRYRTLRSLFSFVHLFNYTLFSLLFTSLFSGELWCALLRKKNARNEISDHQNDKKYFASFSDRTNFSLFLSLKFVDKDYPYVFARVKQFGRQKIRVRSGWLLRVFDKET
jgi:hypothetical protein